MTIVTATLKQMPELTKPRRKFLAALIATMLAVRGRVNYRNLARYGSYCEQTYARHFARPFPWLAYHAQVIRDTVPAAHRVLLAQDASFLPKSDQATWGLGRFYNGCAGRLERGLEISTLALVDLTQKGAYVVAVEQTPASLRVMRNQSPTTSVAAASSKTSPCPMANWLASSSPCWGSRRAGRWRWIARTGSWDQRS